MKEEEIKELFEQFEAIANEYEGVDVGVQENLHKCWVIANGVISKELSKKQKHHVPMQGKRYHTILLMSAKWSPLVLDLSVKSKTTC